MQDKTAQDITLHPNSWLKEMAHLNPAIWNVSRCLRAALGVGVPMAIGYATDTLIYTMWLSLGAMFPSMGERDAPYSFTIQKILISAPIGASGFLLGYLNVWGVDWCWIVLVMTLLGFAAAIASTYSAAISVGCLQFMVMAAVSLGNPELKQVGLFSLLLLGGAAFYLLLVFIEKFVWPHRVRRDAIIQVLQALSAICDQKLSRDDTEQVRLQYNIKYEALYTLMLQTRFHALGHNEIVDQTAAVVQDIDILFAALMAESNLDQVQQLRTHLQNLTDALQQNKHLGTLVAGNGAICNAVNDLTLALQGKTTPSASPNGTKTPPLPLRLLLQKLTPGRTTLLSAIAFALCIAIAYAMHWFYQASHWYWVPMTVSIVMKPELGSIFVRAVQRASGTAVGVAVGGLMLAFIPVGPLFILLIAAITFLLPWLSQRNYALTAFAVTPLVLVLIDFISPDHQGLEYAYLRLVDTLIGCAIVLVFGYLLFPRRHFNELNKTMNDARHAISVYLDSVLTNRQQPEVASVSEARRTAYSKLVDMRTALQKSMAEPPPAGYEAAAWFPLVACAARLCDAVTVYSASASAEPDPQEWAWLQQMPQAIEGLKTLPTVPETTLNRNTPESLLIASINKESALRESLYERVQPPKRGATPTAAAWQTS